MELTHEGAEFIRYASEMLKQIDELESFYKKGSPRRQRFSVSVPRACYISEAFAEFSKSIGKDSAEIFYKETNSERTIKNLIEGDYKLGIIRYAENYDKYFKTMLDEKGLVYELVAEFSYSLLMSRDNPLAENDEITFDDLIPYIEVAHADPYVPSLPLAKVVKEELPDNIDRRIFIFERASQFDILSENPETFMWVSPTSKKLLDRYGLVEKKCVDNRRVYKDVFIYRKGYNLTTLDKRFITTVCESKRAHFK